jgi:hypothetical protein
MEQKIEKVEHEKEQQPYETPQLTKHGSVEQVTGGEPTFSSVDSGT